jgi:hypothetical protein
MCRVCETICDVPSSSTLIAHLLISFMSHWFHSPASPTTPHPPPLTPHPPLTHPTPTPHPHHPDTPLSDDTLRLLFGKNYQTPLVNLFKRQMGSVPSTNGDPNGITYSALHAYLTTKGTLASLISPSIVYVC